MTQPASGRLLGLIAGDLQGHRQTGTADGLTAFVPESGVGPTLVVGQRVQKRFLGRTEIAQFRVEGLASGKGPARLSVHHTGKLRTDGIEIRVVEGSGAVAAVADSLAADTVFAAAAASLDFTRFDIALDGERFRATLELMGASFVSIALPPIRSYVRLHRDQGDALIGCASALQRLLGDGG